MQPSTQASLSAKLICIYDTGLTEDILIELKSAHAGTRVLCMRMREDVFFQGKYPTINNYSPKAR